MDINRDAPATAEGELQIAADPQTVFSVISAVDQWPSWNPDVRSVTLQGPVQPGTVFRWKAGPSTLTSTLRVVIELVLFSTAAGALALAGQPVLAVVLGVAALATSLLNASQERRAKADIQRR
jgi:hypothetical protein